MTQSFWRILIAICFALGAIAETVAQDAVIQPMGSLVPETYPRWDAIGESPVSQPIETQSIQPDALHVDSSRLETSPNKEVTPQMNQSHQGRRKRWSALMPLIALGAILLAAWLIAPAT